MKIGQKIRALPEAMHLSQGDVERKTGLIRAYTSRVENGFTVPTVETLEKFAYALEIPLYQFFTDGETVKMPRSRATKNGIGSPHGRELRRFATAFKGVSDRDKRILLVVAQKDGAAKCEALTCVGTAGSHPA
jgi:transcriptional regulator with XRE-family HTH domain